MENERLGATVGVDWAGYVVSEGSIWACCDMQPPCVYDRRGRSLPCRCQSSEDSLRKQTAEHRMLPADEGLMRLHMHPQ